MAKTDWSLNDTVQPQDMNAIGEEIHQLREDVDNIEIPPASVAEAGIVKLSNATNSTSETLAATPRAVKSAYDAATAAQTTANAANTAAAAAETPSGAQSKVDAHATLTTAHGAVSTATANRLILRDAAGRAKVAAPAAADDIARKDTVDNAVGTLSSLLTTAKGNTVAAINELFTNVSNGKTQIASAITGKGVPASGSDTFAQLSEKIGLIQTTSFGIIDINRVETSPTWVKVGKRFVPICQLPAGIKIISFRVTGNPVHQIGPNVNYYDGSGGSWNRIVLRNVGGSSYITLVDPYLRRSENSVVLSFQYEYGTNMVYSVFQNSSDTVYNIDNTGISDGVVDLTAPTELCFYNQVFGLGDGSMPMKCNIVGRLYYA